MAAGAEMARVFDVCIVGGGMVGAASALHLADSGRRVCVIGSRELPSSSDDCSRQVTSEARTTRDWVGKFREVERRSGIKFWTEEAGLLRVRPGEERSQAGAAGTKTLVRGWELRDFFSGPGFQAELLQSGYGWMDPRKFIEACRRAAERTDRAPSWREGRVVRVEPAEQGSYRVCTADGTPGVMARAVVLTVGAFASLTPTLCTSPLRSTVMWGKVVYHAEVTPTTARKLLGGKVGMPCFFIRPEAGTVPEPEVGYSGRKSGTYFYGFPPIQYPDGKWRIKI
eukprot:Hpha_TRINITY_DN24291_c0_g1::TRINITY_DN24291_c0_g1_i1::g.36019::m.36019